MKVKLFKFVNTLILLNLAISGQAFACRNETAQALQMVESAQKSVAGTAAGACTSNVQHSTVTSSTATATGGGAGAAATSSSQAASSTPGWAPALVAGVYYQGNAHVDTIATAPDSWQASMGRSSGNKAYAPTFKMNILQLGSNEAGKYRTIVFQGVCPVAKCAGLASCGAGDRDTFGSVNERQLAAKLAELAHPDGCHVYIRNCMENHAKAPFANPNQFVRFLQAFADSGFHFVVSGRNPHADPASAEFIPPGNLPNAQDADDRMWDRNKGAIVLYREAAFSYHAQARTAHHQSSVPLIRGPRILDMD